MPGFHGLLFGTGVGISSAEMLKRAEQIPTILVVDEDRHILSAFRDFFAREHCRMLSAVSAREGITILASNDVQLLVLDIQRIGAEIREIIRRFRQDRRESPIIVVAADPGIVSEQELRTLGASTILFKPLEIETLRSAVQQLLHLPHVHQ